MEKIDFVITWVDGNDEKWLAEKQKYSNVKGDSSKNRFREYDNLQYLFRGIEKYAPWVNKVYFITWGHLPVWLNTNCEKLEIINHKDYIPTEYLPTFSSNVIEMNLHRIESLSEKFVVFNDDFFVLKNLKQKDFFENDLPKDMYIEFVKQNCSNRHKIMKRNYDEIINKYFSKKDFVKNNLSRVFNLKYGMKNFKTLSNIGKKEFCDFHNEHLTRPFLKKTFKEIWEKEFEKVDAACKNKFRADNDLGTMICRYWQLLSGNFIPTGSMGKYFDLSNDNSQIIKAIEKHKHKIICVNDADPNIDFEKAKQELNMVLQKTLPNKSSFEK